MDKDNLKRIRELQKREMEQYKSKVALNTLFLESKPHILNVDTKKKNILDIPYQSSEDFSPSLGDRDISISDDSSSYDSELSSLSDDESKQNNLIQKQFSSKSFQQINGKVTEDILSNINVSGTSEESLKGTYTVSDNVNDIDIEDNIYGTSQLSELLSNPVLLPNRTFNKAIIKMSKSNKYPKIKTMVDDLIQSRNKSSGGTSKKGGMFHSLMMNEQINVIIDPVKYSRKIVVEPKKLQSSGGTTIHSIDSIPHLSSSNKTKLLNICNSLSKIEKDKLIDDIKLNKKSVDEIN